MATVVCVHGIAQQHGGAYVLAGAWVNALRSGLDLTGDDGRQLAAGLRPEDVRVAFWGDLFRPPGRYLGPSGLDAAPNDLTELDRALLRAWWEAAAEDDPHVTSPEARTLAAVPDWVQRALRALACSVFFSGIAERAMLGNLVQVRRYLTDPETRRAVRQRLVDEVGDDTLLVIGHSLGSVVAYEALCAHPEWPVTDFITLGSPLGIPNVVFDRLVPEPWPEGTAVRGRWPGGIRRWTNVADRRDLVALEKELARWFGERVEDVLVDNGAHAHDAAPYLTARETGDAVLRALRPLLGSADGE